MDGQWRWSEVRTHASPAHDDLLTWASEEDCFEDVMSIVHLGVDKHHRAFCRLGRADERCARVLRVQRRGDPGLGAGARAVARRDGGQGRPAATALVYADQNVFPQMKRFQS